MFMYIESHAICFIYHTVGGFIFLGFEVTRLNLRPFLVIIRVALANIIRWLLIACLCGVSYPCATNKCSCYIKWFLKYVVSNALIMMSF